MYPWLFTDELALLQEEDEFQTAAPVPAAGFAKSKTEEGLGHDAKNRLTAKVDTSHLHSGR